MNYKALFTQWRIIVLILFLIFSFVAIQPHIFGVDGVTIRSIGHNSSASVAGLENPSAKATPLAKERIVSLNGKQVNSPEEFYTQVASLLVNQTVQLQTTKKSYILTTPETKDLGIKVSEAPTSNLRKGLDLEGGTRVLLKPTEKISEDDLSSTISSLQERLNVYGLSDVIVREAKDLSGDYYILIEIAGVTEEEVSDLLAKQGKFEAKIANQTVFLGGKSDITYVCRSAECSGINPSVGCSLVSDGYACGFFFSITTTPEAAERQARITDSLSVVHDPSGSYLSDDIVLYLDDREVDRLRIGSELKGRATTQIQISGSGVGRTQQEAADKSIENMKRLQTVIITGSLPVKLDVVKIDTVSPSLGKEFLNNIFLVGGLVLIAVTLVIYVRYRQIKVVLPMALALVTELILILGFAALVGWNLDLAGIAGILIALGTGVDHLIIITDETLKGQESTSWAKRIKNAMYIVIGAYLTTLIGMLPLLWAGAGLLKGFALTTIAGVSFGVFLTRPAYAAIVEEVLK